MEYQKVDLELDSTGRSQNLDQRIARITTMFQSGLVRQEIAVEAIRKLSHGELVREIETTRLVVKPVDAVATDLEIRKNWDEALAARAKEQGIAPRSKPTLTEDVQPIEEVPVEATPFPQEH